MLAVSLLVALSDARFKCSGLGSAYYYAFLELFGIFLMEASPRVTRSSAKRWMIGSWWLTVFVLTSGFTGHMKASLTMKDEGGRLDSLHDLAVRPDVVPVIIRGTAYVELFSSAPDGDQQIVWARANRMKSILTVEHVFTREIFDDVLLGKSSAPDGDQQIVWARANRMKSILTVEHVFTREIFDDVLLGKSVVFLEPTLFYHAVSSLYKSIPRGEFYLAREKTVNITMGMWINRGLAVDLRRKLHER